MVQDRSTLVTMWARAFVLYWVSVGLKHSNTAPSHSDKHYTHSAGPDYSTAASNQGIMGDRDLAMDGATSLPVDPNSIAIYVIVWQRISRNIEVPLVSPTCDPVCARSRLTSPH